MRGKNGFNLNQEHIRTDRRLALVAMLVTFRRCNWETMPAIAQLVASIKTMAIVEQRQACCVEPVIAIGMDEQLRGEAGLPMHTSNPDLCRSCMAGTARPNRVSIENDICAGVTENQRLRTPLAFSAGGSTPATRHVNGT